MGTDRTEHTDRTGRDREFLADRFEEHRGHLRAVAYRMLGSLAEADDAVQEAWLRLDRSDTEDVANLGGWLTTVVGRVCLDQLRSRTRRAERAWPEADLGPAGSDTGPLGPEPLLSGPHGIEPEQQALLADSVGLALLVVLEQLAPAERLAFVLHDMFAVPFEEIAPIVDRTPAATRQLASRARRRVRGGAPEPDGDVRTQREAVEAFLAAARDGDFARLLTVLDPEVVLRVDLGAAAGGLTPPLVGAEPVARQALTFAAMAPFAVPALVGGLPGAVNLPPGASAPVSVMGVTVRGGRIVTIDILADPERLSRFDITVLED
ncbi:sigma-70 family RNA polymerase sigma factor [Streptomyces sp. BI20]|uniref:sigma-70 family RNA polymerase sigma factor n=1 Tax=Streptomyces sp. BI20 TaxID=3403460 RepID=UPI003C7414A3